MDYAQPRPGMKVLDLAAGTGEPAISLASRVAPGGKVTALDLSAELLEIASGRARERKLTNLVIQQADAHELPFPDNIFDLVTSRFGVMFFETKALHEARRVLKPGAPLVITFSNRCVATKAIACWCLLDEAGHLCLIAQHFAEAGSWADVRCLDRTPPGGGQPLYAVIGRSLGAGRPGSSD